MTHKFKVGDKVTVLGGRGNEKRVGKIFTISEIDPRSEIYLGDLDRNGNISLSGKSSWVFEPEHLELVEEWSPSGITLHSGSVEGYIDKAIEYMKPGGLYPINTGFMGEVGGYKFYQNKEEKSIMSKISSYVKNLTLSADEKLLRKYGLKNECGEVTREGQEAIWENFYNSPENIAYLVSIAQGLEEESKKNK